MGRCSICGKKSFLLETNECFSCGKEVCKNCSIKPLITVDFHNERVPIYSCSGNCIDVFRRYLSNFEGGANNQEFDDLLKSFIAKYYPSFRESGKLEIVEGKPEFYDIRYEFIENCEKKYPQGKRGGMGEYKVERLIPPDTRISGKILVTASGIVFEPKHKNEEKLEIAVDKIRDVRFATEKEISAFRIVFEGVINAVLNPRIHKLLLIDFEDKFGIIQHLTFEGGDEIVNAERGLYAMRKAEKLKGE